LRERHAVRGAILRCGGARVMSRPRDHRTLRTRRRRRLVVRQRPLHDPAQAGRASQARGPTLPKPPSGRRSTSQSTRANSGWRPSPGCATTKTLSVWPSRTCSTAERMRGRLCDRCATAANSGFWSSRTCATTKTLSWRVSNSQSKGKNLMFFHCFSQQDNTQQMVASNLLDGHRQNLSWCQNGGCPVFDETRLQRFDNGFTASAAGFRRRFFVRDRSYSAPHFCRTILYRHVATRPDT